MSVLEEFRKASPVGFCLSDALNPAQSYKYFICGKGCQLGVLFEDSVNVYFEWIRENGRPVAYPPAVRYKWWPKRECARLIAAGVWEVTGADEVAA